MPDIGNDFGCRLTHSQDQLLTPNVPLALAFGTKLYDHGDLHDLEAPTRITFPKAGRYLVGGQVSVGDGVDDYRRMFIRKNGSYTVLWIDSVSGFAGFLCGATIIDVVVGDYIELMAVSSNAKPVYTSASVGVGPGDFTPVFFAQKIDKAG